LLQQSAGDSCRPIATDVGEEQHDFFFAQNEIERLRRDAREWQASLDKFLSSRP